MIYGPNSAGYIKLGGVTVPIKCSDVRRDDSGETDLIHAAAPPLPPQSLRNSSCREDIEQRSVVNGELRFNFPHLPPPLASDAPDF